MIYDDVWNRELSEYDGFRCNLEVWHGLNNRITEEEADLGEVMRRMKEYRKNAIMFAGKHGCSENVLYCVIQHDEALDIIANWIHENLDEKGFGRESIFVNHGTGRNISSWVPFLGGVCSVIATAYIVAFLDVNAKALFD